MSQAEYLIPFIVKFMEPIISREQKMTLLRFRYENGVEGCIGIRDEAVETLRRALEKITEKNTDMEEVG
ncbi:hypothetical protein [Solidesulfovibrio sp. C21]|uniref:hypothetical protein n=1 Tax=Solidesulfovibrio sp. C21 TaxID=3398613 RepID=UPI0039FBCE80